MQNVIVLAIFALVCFVQNMAFTASSRSRNSGDPNYHRRCAWASNGVYYVANLVLTIFIIQWQKSILMIALSGLVYIFATTEGSVLMMRMMLKTESGKRKVGAN